MTTVKLARWEKHVTAARRQGMPLSQYAREHGISRYTLYAAQRQLRSQGAAAKRLARRSLAAFVPVEVAGSAPSAVRARLPNGVQLEFGHLDPSACAALVGMLAALACSG
jgi:transposase-like protein